MPSINVSHVTYQRLAELANVTGKSVSAVTIEAINDWMDITGEVILKRRKKTAPVKNRTRRRAGAQIVEFRPMTG